MGESGSKPGGLIAPKYEPFHIIDVNYKNVNGMYIPASILLPNGIKSGKHPVAVRWHGGGFGTGQRLFADWYGDWTLALSQQHSAITITPDYRLMPEAKGIDILQDAKDFYAWLFSPGNLAQSLPPDVEPDLDNIIVTGESAGGWHALEAGFLEPKRVAAIISHYPMIDMRAPHFSEYYHKDIFSPPIPQKDPSILEDFVKQLTGHEVVTSRNVPDGEDFVMTIVQHGLYPQYFGPEPELYPLEMLDRVKLYPPVWILHGEKDSIVPIEGSKKFATKLKEKFLDTPLHLSFEEGEEHGFDLHDAKSGGPASMETDWVKSGLQFIGKFWPV